MDSLTRDVKAKTAHASTNQDDQKVQNGECDLPRRREPLALVDVQPVHTTKTVTEPTSKQGANKAQQIAENGNGIGNDPGNDPASKSNTNPRANGNCVTLLHAVSAAEHADVNVLETDVAVDDTSTNNLRMLVGEREESVNQWRTYSRNGYSICNFLQHGTGRSKSGRSDLLTNVVVNNHGSNGVKDNLESLEHNQSLGEIPGLFHLSE